MFTNKQLLMPANKKAFLKMVSLPAIVLEAEEADRFIDYIIDESVGCQEDARCCCHLRR